MMNLILDFLLAAGIGAVIMVFCSQVKRVCRNMLLGA